MTSLFPNPTQALSQGIFSNLNLTSSQQTQIQSIVGNAQNGHTPFSQVVSQVESLLSPTQQSTFKSDLQQLRIQAGGGHRHHSGVGSSASSLLGSSATEAFGVSNSTGTSSTTTTDAFGNPVTTPGSALADAFGVQSSSNASTLPNASNVYSPFSVLAAQYQVQQQLQAGNIGSLI